MRLISVVFLSSCLAIAARTGAQTIGEPVCSNAEITTINALFQRGYDIAMRVVETEDVEYAISAMTAYQQQWEGTKAGLKTGCRAAFTRLEEDLVKQQKSRQELHSSPVQVPSILYDESSDTYHAPGLVSCGPSGCVAP